MIPSVPVRSPRRALAVLATLVVAAVGTLVGSAPSEGRAAFPPQRPTRVLVLGDSVILGAASALPAALPGREVVQDAVVSRSTAATASAGAGHGTDWDVVVVLVGHNDGGSTAYQAPYGQLLDQFAAVPRIVVLTLHDVRPGYAGVNAWLGSQAASRANVSLADWNAVVSANPGSTAGDGLHLNGTGAGLLAGLVAEQVEAAEAQHGWAELAAAKARFEATSTTTSTSTTTTLPPTTTTTPATTTTAEVQLAPPVSIDRPEGSATTTTDPAFAGTVKNPPGGDGSGDPFPGWLVWALPAGLVVGAAAIVAARLRRPSTTDPTGTPAERPVP